MANNENLGASFSIDVTNLKAGLTQANRLIRESESEFKAAAAGMDKWTDSQEGLEARIKHLNTATDLQRKKVDALQDEYDKLIADGLDPASREAVELRTKINKETEALNKNEAELKRQTKALEELGNETEDVADKTDDASDGFTVMKGAAAELVANGINALVGGCKQAISTLLALGEETREYRENLIKLQTSFQTANLSAEDAEKTFEDLYSIMGDEGAATEAAQQLAKISKGEKDLEANTRILTGVMAEYGASIPLEGLAEGIAASSAMSSVQGVLADALEWQGINLEEYNEKLAELSTEEKRSAYIQKTLTDLYGKSADAYLENNKSVISARKETKKYNDQMAKLGEAIEPVNAEITEFKTELAKEFVPVVKNKVAPAIKEFTQNLKDSGAVEKTGKVIGYVAENFETLATATLTAVTVYKTFSAAMAISSAITATQTAVAGLSAGVSFATKMQVGWNAAMTANPIGAVLTAVGLLTAGIALLANKEADASTKTDLLSESQRAAVTASEEAAAAYRETKKAADEMAAAASANIDYTQTLWEELKTLADASGKVKDSDKARADFIIGELNDALGTEYSMTGNIIKNYKDMVKSIDDVIEKKKAQILLEAYEKSYAEAVKNVSAAEQERAIKAQELVAQQNKVTEAEKGVAAAREEAIEYYKRGTDAAIAHGNEIIRKAEKNLEEEKTLLSEKESAFKTTDTTVKGYYDNINSYETASGLILKGETEKAIGYLNKYGGGFQTAASVAKKSKDEQLKILKEQVVNTEINVGLMEAEYKNLPKTASEEEKKQAKIRLDNAKKQAKDAKDEYYKVGGNMVEGMKKGAEDGEWTLTGALKKTVLSGLAAAKKALGIKSPSRVFRKEVGKQIPAGAALGVEDGTPSVVKAIKGQVKAMQDAYDLSGVTGTVGANINRSTPATAQQQNNGGVTVYQTNNYKQAYSSPIEKYKSKQQLFAVARQMKAGAF